MITEIDTAIFYLINRTLANRALDFVMPLFARHEDWIVVVVIMLTILLYRDLEKALIVILLCGFAVSLNDSSIHFFFKPFWGRARPCNMLPPDTVRMLVRCGESFSFPSQHAANMFVVGAIFAWKYRKYAIIPLIIAFMAAYSRVYLGVHYPFDVTGGAILGTAWGAGALYIEHLFRTIRGKDEQF